jgi:predicted dehydrogenase
MNYNQQTPLRLAVIGTGHLGRIHARLAAGLSSARLVAVVDSCDKAREAVATEIGTRGVADHRDLIGEIDAAIVATPTSTHSKVASELMQAGIHTLIEKPLAPTLAECEHLVQLARQQNLILQVGHVERFNPGFTSVQGKLTDPKYIDAQRTSGYTFRSTDVGVVMDLMIHDIDVVLSLVQSPLQSVEAVGLSVLGSHEDIVNARLHFTSGCVVSLTASRVSYQSQRMMQVFTSRAFASIDFGSRTATLVEPCESVLRREFNADNLTPVRQQEFQQQCFTETLIKQTVAGPEINAIEQEQMDFTTAIEQNRRPQVDGADGRDAVAIAELILEQVDAHTWDGKQLGRQGPRAMPALPILSGADHWFQRDRGTPQRKAG